MTRQIKLGLWALFLLAVLVGVSHRFGGNNDKVLGISLKIPKLMWAQTLTFDFSDKETKDSPGLKAVVEKSLQGKDGTFGVYIEELPASPSAQLSDRETYGLLENEPFPSASLYKLVLMAAVLKEVENGRLDLNSTLTSTKTHLTQVYGGVDFGYEDSPEQISYTVEEAMERVGRISDNFAAIMLTDKLRSLPHQDGEEGLLYQMVDQLGMKNTDFSADPIQTTPYDIGLFFKKLYLGQVVSSTVSAKIVNLLNLSVIDDRIPAQLPDDVTVVHKTGELSHVRHDAGIIFPPGKNPYVLVVLSKDLVYEDDGVDTIAQLSKDVYQYFTSHP